MRLQDNKKGCRVKKNYSLMLYQRVTGDFYTINSEGKFTLPRGYLGVVHVRRTWYNVINMIWHRSGEMRGK